MVRVWPRVLFTRTTSSITHVSRIVTTYIIIMSRPPYIISHSLRCLIALSSASPLHSLWPALHWAVAVGGCSLLSRNTCPARVPMLQARAGRWFVSVPSNGRRIVQTPVQTKPRGVLFNFIGFLVELIVGCPHQSPNDMTVIMCCP